MSRRARTVWFPMVSALLFLWISARIAIGQPPPFAPGETLNYELYWTIVPAGTGVLRVLPMTTIDGRPAWHFQLTARSNAFIDPFYKVRDTIDAYADPSMTHSLYYRKHQHEGSTQRVITVSFDWARRRAIYHKVERERVSDKETPLMDGTFDPLSSFFYVRGIDPGSHPVIERPITDGNRNVIAQVRVIRRETIRVSGRDWDTFLVEPDLRNIGGVFEKKKNARIRIWITADRRHIPVRLKSKATVGSFVADLISASGLTH